MKEFLTSLFLGFIEGLTEFIPVSSTAHLILLTDGLNFPAPPGHVFEVFIQLGAILAVIVLYHKKLWRTFIGLPHDRTAQRFTLNVFIGTLPALVVGALAHGFIKGHLYNPHVIAVSLIAGGLIILLFDRRFKNPEIQSLDDITPRRAFLVGCCQMVALIPGVSRSGASIMGGLSLGLSRTVAAEFSFFLAIPVMICAVLFDIVKNWDMLRHYEGWNLMAVGFLASFITALVVIKFALRFISSHGFAPFAWYRIVIGLVSIYIFW